MLRLGEGAQASDAEVGHYDVDEAIRTFRKKNAELGTRALPVSVLVKGIMRNTGLAEDEVRSMLVGRGVDLNQNGPTPGTRKPPPRISRRSLDRFLTSLEAQPDLSEEPLDTKKGLRARF